MYEIAFRIFLRINKYTILPKNCPEGIASILNFSKLQKYASNMHQIQETAQNSFIHYAI